MKIRVSTIAVGILSLISGIAVGYSIGKTNSSEEEMKNKMLKYYVTLNNWIGKKQKNINLSSYFEKMGYNSVAIYGMKEVGERLYEELKDTKTEVKYAVDQNAESIYADIDVYSPDDDLPEVDVIVVTATYYYNSILNNIKENTVLISIMYANNDIGVIEPIEKIGEIVETL